MVKILTRSRFRHFVAREAADPVRTDAVTVRTDKSTVLTDEIGSTSSCESEENCKSSHKSLNAVQCNNPLRDLIRTFYVYVLSFGS